MLNYYTCKLCCFESDVNTGKPSPLFDKENVDWAPTKDLGHNSIKASNPKRASRLFERGEKKKEHEIAVALLDLSQDTVETQTEDGDVEPLFKEMNIQTEITVDNIENIIAENKRLMEENSCLKKQLKDKTLDERWLQNDNDKVLFYTGLPNLFIPSTWLRNTFHTRQSLLLLSFSSCF